MFLWLKRLIILPSLALFIIMLAGTAVHLVLMPKLGIPADKAGPYSLVFIGLVAVLMVWWYVRTWKSESQQANADSSRPPTSLGRGYLWALVLVLGVPFGHFMIRGTEESNMLREQPGHAAFQAANSLLSGKSQGVAHGSSPMAKELAQEFSQMLRIARQAGIEKRKSAPILSATGGEFLTYCLLTQDSCVFMVHVPDLRKFSSEAKAYLADAALEAARSLMESRQTTIRNIVIGLRGALLYDSVIAGRQANQASSPASRVNGDTACRGYLQGYFSQPPMAAAGPAAPPPEK